MNQVAEATELASELALIVAVLPNPPLSAQLRVIEVCVCASWSNLRVNLDSYTRHRFCCSKTQSLRQSPTFSN